MRSLIHERIIYTCDNLPVLRGMDAGSADLIYLDPPFNTGRGFLEKDTRKKAFEDIWKLGDLHEDEHFWLMREHPAAYDLINAAARINGDSWKAYLIYMGARLAEMRRVLKSTGSIYYHCDPTMAHGIKLLMDAIFGRTRFNNEILWCYTGPSSPGMRRFPRKHDVIFWYGKSGEWTFNGERMRVPYKDPKQTLRRAMDAGRGIGQDEVAKYRARGKRIENWWADITPVGRIKRELTGYPTQKPLALLERIISASSNEGDLILDPFCGCATTCVAAEKLNRRWIGIDLSIQAAKQVKKRLRGETEERVKNAAGLVEHLREPPTRTLPGRRTPDNALKRRLFRAQKGICRGCDQPTRVELMHLDHIIAKTRGGQDTDDNLQLLCGNCNVIKGNRGMPYLLGQLATRQAEEERTRRLREAQEWMKGD